MACKCGDISAGVATLLLENAVNELGFPLQLIDWGLLTKDGRAVVEPRPSWFTVAAGTGDAVDQGGGVYHYVLPVTATINPVTEAFSLGDFSAVYRAYYTVERADCVGGSRRCEFSFRQANVCQGLTTFPEGWIVFRGSRALNVGISNMDGIHAFAINDPAGTFLTLFPMWDGVAPPSTGQRWGTEHIEVHEDLSGQAWVYYASRPPDQSTAVNLRRVRLNGQTDTQLVQPETGAAASHLSAWYDAGAGKYLLLYRVGSVIKKVYDDGAGLTQLQTGITARDLAFAQDGQDYYYIVGNTVRRAPIEGGAFEVETGAIGANRIAVTDTAVYVERSVSSIISVRRYSLDLDSPVDFITTGRAQTNSFTFFYALNRQVGEHYVQQEWITGFDGISRYDNTGAFASEQFFLCGGGTTAGALWGDAINTDDNPFPVANRVSKIYLTVPGDVDDIVKAEADASGQVTIDTDATRAGNARGIAYDNAGDLVYFCNETTDAIYQEGNDGSGPITWATGEDGAFGLAIDDVNGHVYWSKRNDGGKIVRADLGGSSAANKTDIITGEGTGIRHISLDVENGKIYWANATSGLIQRANLNGTSIETVATLSNAYTVCVEPGAGGTYFYYGSTGTAIHRRVKTLASASVQVFALSDHVPSAVNPKQMVIDPGGLWIYFVTSSRVWRFLHSVSGLSGTTGLTVLNGSINAAYEGIALQLV